MQHTCTHTHTHTHKHTQARPAPTAAPSGEHPAVDELEDQLRRLKTVSGEVIKRMSTRMLEALKVRRHSLMHMRRGHGQALEASVCGRRESYLEGA